MLRVGTKAVHSRAQEPRGNVKPEPQRESQGTGRTFQDCRALLSRNRELSGCQVQTVKSGSFQKHEKKPGSHKTFTGFSNCLLKLSNMLSNSNYKTCCTLYWADT